MVTHRTQVLSIVSRVVVIDQGQVVMDGPRDEVLKKLAQNEQKKTTASSAAQTVTSATQASNAAGRTIVIQPDNAATVRKQTKEASIQEQNVESL